jgi:hypothetical protein
VCCYSTVICCSFVAHVFFELFIVKFISFALLPYTARSRVSHKIDNLHATRLALRADEQALSIVARTLGALDDDNLIPAYGFGDVSTGGTAVFSLRDGKKPCAGLDALLRRYRQITPHIQLSGPTSLAPVIRTAIDTVRSTGEYHIRRQCQCSRDAHFVLSSALCARNFHDQ